MHAKSRRSLSAAALPLIALTIAGGFLTPPPAQRVSAPVLPPQQISGLPGVDAPLPSQSKMGLPDVDAPLPSQSKMGLPGVDAQVDRESTLLPDNGSSTAEQTSGR